MTKEEIIDGLKFTMEMFTVDPISGKPIIVPRNSMDKITVDACRGAIELLEQEPRKGYWVITQNKNDGQLKVTCSRCSYKANYFWSDWKNANYCPNCGAEMEK